MGLFVHQNEYKLFKEAHDLNYSLASLPNIADVGWLPLEDFENQPRSFIGIYSMQCCKIY